MPKKNNRSGLKQKPMKAKAVKINRETLKKPSPTAPGRQSINVPSGKVENKLRTKWPPLQNPWSLTPTESIRRGMLPEVIENVAFEYAERAGLNCDALAMSMMAAISSVIPTNIKVAAYDDADKVVAIASGHFFRST